MKTTVTTVYGTHEVSLLDGLAVTPVTSKDGTVLGWNVTHAGSSCSISPGVSRLLSQRLASTWRRALLALDVDWAGLDATDRTAIAATAPLVRSAAASWRSGRA